MVQPLWYVRKAGIVSGPFPSPQIKEGLRLGEIKPQDEISLDGEQWLAILESGQFGKETASTAITPNDTDSIWLSEREQARQRWEEPAASSADVTMTSSLDRARLAALKASHASTQALIDARSHHRPSVLIGIAGVIVLVALGATVWYFGHGEPPIKASIGRVASCQATPGQGVSWAGCKKTMLVFDGEDLHGMDMTRTRLDGTSFIGADLSYSDLTRASLRGANLQGAKLKGTNLENADLTGADLRGADLAYTSFHGALVEGLRLDGAIMGKTTWTDGRLCDQMEPCL